MLGLQTDWYPSMLVICNSYKDYDVPITFAALQFFIWTILVWFKHVILNRQGCTWCPSAVTDTRPSAIFWPCWLMLTYNEGLAQYYSISSQGSFWVWAEPMREVFSHWLSPYPWWSLPLPTHWRYCSLVLSYPYINVIIRSYRFENQIHRKANPSWY